MSAPTLPSEDEAPPIGGRWSVLYAVVLGALAVVIAVLWWLTEHYS